MVDYIPLNSNTTRLLTSQQVKPAATMQLHFFGFWCLRSCRRSSGGRTVLVAAPQLKTVEKEDHIIFMENGAVMEGTQEELMKQREHYHRWKELSDIQHRLYGGEWRLLQGNITPTGAGEHRQQSHSSSNCKHHLLCDVLID